MASLLILTCVWLLFLAAVLYVLGGVPARGLTGRLSGWLGQARGWIDAESRAGMLLRDVLTEREYRQLTQRGYIEIASPHYPDRVYRIPGVPGRVRVLHRNRALWELCLEPTESLPHSDVIVMHKLMILGNESEYLATANRFAPGTRWMTHPVH